MGTMPMYAQGKIAVHAKNPEARREAFPDDPAVNIPNSLSMLTAIAVYMIYCKKANITLAAAGANRLSLTVVRKDHQFSLLSSSVRFMAICSVPGQRVCPIAKSAAIGDSESGCYFFCEFRKRLDLFTGRALLFCNNRPVFLPIFPATGYPISVALFAFFAQAVATAFIGVEVIEWFVRFAFLASLLWYDILSQSLISFTDARLNSR